ncbi:sulfatase-like hydrolase/transferase, partial [Verrucomicrobiales bacterium]|nr:sulfatase-like hydrolase/transferase [Verrucomicrobiales bacterium]
MKNRLAPIFLWAVCIVSTLGAESTKLNFVFILVDDLGKQDMSCEGSTFYQTPNIDALARSGMRFSNGYSTCQVCSPSRASIMLGTYPARNKIT